MMWMSNSENGGVLYNAEMEIHGSRPIRKRHHFHVGKVQIK